MNRRSFAGKLFGMVGGLFTLSKDNSKTPEAELAVKDITTSSSGEIKIPIMVRDTNGVLLSEKQTETEVGMSYVTVKHPIPDEVVILGDPPSGPRRVMKTRRLQKTIGDRNIAGWWSGYVYVEKLK